MKASVSWSHHCRLSSTSSSRSADLEQGSGQPLEEAVALPGVDHRPLAAWHGPRRVRPDGTSRSTSSAPDRVERRPALLGPRGSAASRDRRQREAPGRPEALRLRHDRTLPPQAAASSATSRVLPTPGSPRTTTTAGLPCRRRAPRRRAAHGLHVRARRAALPQVRTARLSARGRASRWTPDLLRARSLFSTARVAGRVRRPARAPAPTRSGGRCSRLRPGRRGRPATPSAPGSRSPQGPQRIRRRAASTAPARSPRPRPGVAEQVEQVDALAFKFGTELQHPVVVAARQELALVAGRRRRCACASTASTSVGACRGEGGRPFGGELADVDRGRRRCPASRGRGRSRRGRVAAAAHRRRWCSSRRRLVRACSSVESGQKSAAMCWRVCGLSVCAARKATRAIVREDRSRTVPAASASTCSPSRVTCSNAGTSRGRSAVCAWVRRRWVLPDVRWKGRPGR